jgi:predicted nucleic acid-binding protein
MFLADTNIFLEVLLAGDKADACKAFLAENYGKIHISDFSIHSIGVILFRQRRELVFKAFFEDVSINTQIVSLARESYLRLQEI